MNTATMPMDFQLLPLEVPHVTEALTLFNQLAGGRELVLKPLPEAGFQQAFFHPKDKVTAQAVCAVSDGALVGFAGGNRAEGAGYAYLTFVAVMPEHRRRGIGTALIREVERLLLLDAETEGTPLQGIDARFLNPAAFEWVVPGTDGHDHPNAPGVDVSTAGYLFMKNIGYHDLDHVNSFHRPLAGYTHGEAVTQALASLARGGLRITLFEPGRHTGMEDLIADLGSEVWRETLLSNAAKPGGGLPVMILEDGDRMCGFAGPMDVQPSGRGYFNGIGIHSEYRRRGAGKALFSSLCMGLGEMGAGFMTLFTGETNPARNIYESAGFKIVKVWACMRKTLETDTQK